jgi:hypothetical protein
MENSMTFVVLPKADNTSLEEAQRYYNEAITYLRQSDMASSIIDELTALPQHITVKVGVGYSDKYIHPKPDDNITGGIIEWDPTCPLNVKDKARYRPQVSWVQDTTERHGFLWLQQRRLDVVGTISPMVALLHEMGHAYQFFGDKDGYRQATRSMAKPHEDNVVAAIENTVVLELRARGETEGIRWGYLDTV